MPDPNKAESLEKKTTRIDKNFSDELEDIKDKRMKEGKDKKRISDRMITNLIPKHNHWKEIKKDIINFCFDKKGIATEGLFDFIVTGFLMIIVMGILMYVFNIFTTNLSIDIMIGSVNLSNATGQTLGQLNSAALSRLDTIGMFILMGMVLGMFINAYFTRHNYPKLFIIVDILLIWFAYILASYVSNSYETIIGLDPFSSTFTTVLSKASTFLLRLPIITTIVGVIIMIITYSGIPRSFKEEVFISQS